MISLCPANKTMSNGLMLTMNKLTNTFVIKPIYSNIVTVRFKQTYFTEKIFKFPLNAVEKGMYNILQIVKITA